MSLIVSVSGMEPEYEVARTVADVAVYGAARDTLASVVPIGCTGLVSLGVCGGLDPRLKRGSLVIPDRVVTTNGVYTPAVGWIEAIEATLERAACCQAFLGVNALSEENVWADDPADRAAIFAKTGCGILDNETCAVAEFAAAHQLPFVVLRTVSDESDDTVINDPNELTPTGGVNIFDDIRDFITHPVTIVHEAIGFNEAMDTLRKVATALGPGLRAPT